MSPLEEGSKVPLRVADSPHVRTLCWNIPDIKSFLLLVGTLPGNVIKLISEGNAKFDGCRGPFYLPTDLSSIKDIKKIDLSSLGGRLQGDIKVLEHLPQLTSVFMGNTAVQGTTGFCFF